MPAKKPSSWALTIPMADDELVPVGRLQVPQSFTVRVAHDAATVDLRFQVQGGAPVCMEVRVTGPGEGAEVTYSSLAGVRVRDALDEAILLMTYELEEKELAQHWDPEQDLPKLNYSRRRDLLSEVQRARSSRKTRITPELLQEVARVYRANVRDNPTQAVADHFDREHRTATLYVKKAREAGYLGAAIKGKAGEQ